MSYQYNMLSDFVLSWTFDILDRLNYEIHRNWCSTNIDETVVYIDSDKM